MALLCFVSAQCALSGSENNGRGTKAIALGDAFVAVADNAWAVYYNPAGLAFLGQWEFSGFMIPGQFGLEELRTSAFAVAVPWTSVGAGITMEQFGFDLYRETTFRLGIAVAMDDKFAAGLTCGVTRFAIEGYGSENQPDVDAGILCHASEEINVGASLGNLTGSTIGSFRERLPCVLRMGFSYQSPDGFLLTFECEKDARYPLSVKGGIQQKIFGVLNLRVGAANNPDKFTAGLSVAYEGCEIGYAAYSHLELGWTHQFEVRVQIRE